MAVQYRIRQMKTHPDKLRPLEKDNEYEIISLKRTHVSVEAKRQDEEARLRILIDHRAKTVTITRVDGWAVPIDLYVALTLRVGRQMGINLSDGLMRPASHPEGDELRFSSTDTEHLFGIFHRLKEMNEWTSESRAHSL